MATKRGVLKLGAYVDLASNCGTSEKQGQLYVRSLHRLWMEITSLLTDLRDTSETEKSEYGHASGSLRRIVA